jgi:hypothetical protein
VTDLLDARCISCGGGIPDVNSEMGRAVVHMLYVLGFPQHRIGFLFDADHGSQALKFSEAPLKPESSVSTSG